MRLDLEEKFITKYVLKHKRDRNLGFVRNERNRGQFLGTLYHGSHFDERLFRELQGNHEQQMLALHKIAESVGLATSCYFISVDPQLDGKEIPAQEAIKHVLNSGGTVLIFGDLNAVYYGGEPPNTRYISV